MRRLAVNPVPCTGCLSCEAACALARSGAQDRRESALRVALDPFGGAHSHIFCRHCDDAPCASVCPTGALARDAATGALVIGEESCLRCGLCADACPFGAIALRGERIPSKCDLCGGQPRCVAACAFGVLRYLGDGDPSAGFVGMPSGEQDPGLGRGPAGTGGSD